MTLILGSANLQLDDHSEGRQRLRVIPTVTDLGAAVFAVAPFNWSSQMHLRSEPMRRGNMYLRRGKRARDKSAPHHINILQRFWCWRRRGGGGGDGGGKNVILLFIFQIIIVAVAVAVQLILRIPRLRVRRRGRPLQQLSPLPRGLSSKLG